MITRIILSGGAGTRLWPLSRKLLPKKFLPLVSAHTMIQETVLRPTGPDTGFGYIEAGEPLAGRRVGVEFKRADAPRLTASMRTALHDLKPAALYVVYPGTRRYALAEKVEAVPLSELAGK